VIAAQTARDLAAGRRVTGPTGFVFGLLHEAERAAVVTARRSFAEVWPQIAATPGPAALAKVED
jgi:hypothetical protein